MSYCIKCGSKNYGFSNGLHEVWICYRCGGYLVTREDIDDTFIQSIQKDPLIIIEYIKNGVLEPICKID